jgi:hypothetical protein
MAAATEDLEPRSSRHSQAAPAVNAERYKRLLYLCALPPSGGSGFQIIAKQILRAYDQAALHVLCCQRWYDFGAAQGPQSYLPCSHTTVPDYGIHLSPQRFTTPLSEDLNCLRVPHILRAARKIIERERIEAIFTILFSTDFALAALLLQRATGLPLYAFEMDDFEAKNPFFLHHHLNRRYHRDLLRAAKEAWFISPAMVDDYRARFGVEGRFLCQAVDVDRYQAAAQGAAVPGTGDEIKLVYTGSVNTGFKQALKFVCDMVNAGIVIDGRPVRLEMYTQTQHPDLAGPRVTMPGYVPTEAIPKVLASADILLMGVSFEKAVEGIVRTSLFTKTIDYLASGRPMLMLAPEYSAVARYCRDGAAIKDTALVVDRLDRGAIEAAIRRPLANRTETADRCARGVELVRRYHGPPAVDDVFLSHFRAAT